MKLLDTYKEAHKNLLDYFNCDYTYLDIDDYIGENWFVLNEQVYFQTDPIVYNEHWGLETTYIEEVVEVFSKKDYTLVVSQTRTFDGKCIMIFDNSKEYKPKPEETRGL